MSENLQYAKHSIDTKVQEVEDMQGQYGQEMETFKHKLQTEVLKKEELELENSRKPQSWNVLLMFAASREQPGLVQPATCQGWAGYLCKA